MFLKIITFVIKIINSEKNSLANKKIDLGIKKIHYQYYKLCLFSRIYLNLNEVFSVYCPKATLSLKSIAR